MKTDVHELKIAKKDLEKAIGNMDQIVKECIDEIALRVYRSAVRQTPVDTGFLKGDWTLGAIVKRGKFYQVEILNPADYAIYVEYGHRIVRGGVTYGWIDGVFMLTIAEREVEKRVNRIVERRLKRFYGGLLK